MSTNTQELEDDYNPNYMFCLTKNDLLSKIVKGEIDPVKLAKEELAKRGLDSNGEWIGFKQASKHHGIN